MEVLPSKTVSERRAFSINFGDELPWGSVITGARLDVRVFSGVDPSPRRIFARFISITGPEVVFQVKQGLPGVTYALTLRVAVGAVWYERECLLSVLSDFADTGPLFPVALSVTSMPYAQIYYSNISCSISLGAGTLTGVVTHAHLDNAFIDVSIQPQVGALYIPTVYTGNTDYLSVSIQPITGTLVIPIVPAGSLANASVSISPNNGRVFLSIKAKVNDTASVQITLGTGTLTS